MIPIDIIISSDPFFNLGVNFKSFYNNVQLALIIMTFIILPFCYFFAETFDDFQEVPFSERVSKTIKYLCVFLIFIAAVIFISLSFKKTKGDNELKNWIQNMLDHQNLLENVIFVLISFVTCIGTIFWVKYGSEAMGIIPLELIRGKKSIQESKMELTHDLSVIREKYRNIQQKYARSHVKISKQDQKLLNQLKYQEKLLSFKTEKLSFVEINIGTLHQIVQTLSPFRVMIGFFCLLLSILYFVSLLITTLDRFQHSECNIQCGYLTIHPLYLNPLDSLFTLLNYYHIDTIFFFILNFYILLALLIQLVSNGINMFFINFYDIEKEATLPQAIFMLAFIVNFCVFAVQAQYMSLIQQYITWGQQGHECDSSKCRMTQVGQLFNRIGIDHPVFGNFLFFSNFIFIILFVKNFIVQLLKKKKSYIEVYLKNQDDKEEYFSFDLEEKQNLIN